MAYHQFAYYYDRLMADAPYDEWLQFAEQCWDKYGVPRTVVDLGCGTGNITIPLAQSGIQVAGIDQSEDMLAVARRKAERLGLAHRVPLRQEERTGYPSGEYSPHSASPQGVPSSLEPLRDSAPARDALSPSAGSVFWLQQDMREWDLGQPADAVISFCDSLNYLLTEEEISQIFRHTYNQLNARGLFLFDMNTAALFASYAEEQPFLIDNEDISYVLSCEWEASQRRIEHQLLIFAKEELASPPVAGKRDRYIRIDESHVQRAYPTDWLEQQLYRAGFGSVETWGDFHFSPADENTERVFFAARK